MLIKDMDHVTLPLRAGLNQHYSEMRRVLQDGNSTHQDLEKVLDQLITIAELFKQEIGDMLLYEDHGPAE